MGGGGSKPVFSSEELDVYESCTCLSSAEILLLFAKFQKLVVDLTFTRGGTELYRTTSIAGFLGVLTGVRPGA